MPYKALGLTSYLVCLENCLAIATDQVIMQERHLVRFVNAPFSDWSKDYLGASL